jgi:hypothetical protein
LCGYGGGVGVVLVVPIGGFLCYFGGTTFLLVERLVLINDGAVRVRCQYLSPKLRDFSPLRRCFCDVSFDTMCVATSWLRDYRFVAALGCCFSY